MTTFCTGVLTWTVPWITLTANGLRPGVGIPSTGAVVGAPARARILIVVLQIFIGGEGAGRALAQLPVGADCRVASPAIHRLSRWLKRSFDLLNNARCHTPPPHRPRRPDWQPTERNARMSKLLSKYFHYLLLYPNIHSLTHSQLMLCYGLRPFIDKFYAILTAHQTRNS